MHTHTSLAGSDYTGVPTTTIVFAAGETQSSFDVVILDDEVAEQPESFTASLSNPIQGLMLGGDIIATVNIEDDEGAVMNLFLLIFIRLSQCRADG